MRRFLLTIAALGSIASTAGAYTHFVHYTNRSAPYNAVQEKYDLSALSNKTIKFFLSDSAAAQISQSDQLPAVLSAIREAARVWNGVQTSDLRVAFGGYASTGTPQNTPGADIVFDEMDPLLLGLTATNTGNTLSTGPGGQFVAIKRPLTRLNRDLSVWTTASSGPSFTEAFFLTVVHEMGHALGLQHTFTSSVMSTEITRATSLSAPITLDDIEGLSYLYPSQSYGQDTGSISGRVTFSSGQGIHLASVVAIRPTGGALSALTDPDGRYRIDGLPAGTYFVYVHPVPPAPRAGVAPGDLTLPVDPDGRPIAASAPFDTLFYRGQGLAGTRDSKQAQAIVVTAGTLADSVNFAPNRRNAYGPVTSVTTYTYFGQTPVRPGYLNSSGAVVAVGAGLVTSNGALAPGLSVNFLGGTPVLRQDWPTGCQATCGMLAYSGSLALYLNLPSTFGSTGPRGMVFSLADDIYVLPSGLNLGQSPPPSISSADAVQDGSGVNAVALTGKSLNSDTKFYFGGIPGKLLRFDDTGRAIVAPPPGLTGMRASITAFNSDGQNSTFAQATAAAAATATYSYDNGDPGFVSISPNTLPAGVESMIEITGGNGNFADGVTTVGLGSSDAQVRRVWVMSPNRILANVWVAPNAAIASMTATVISGFQVISQSFAVQIAPAKGNAPALSSQLANAAPPLTGVFAGATAIVSGVNLAGGTLTINDQPVTIVSSSSNQITFVVPSDVQTGPAILKVSNGIDSGSVVIAIDSPPPDVRTVMTLASVTIDTNHAARPGDVLNLLVFNLADKGTTPDASHVRVTIGGIDHPIQAITPFSQGHQVRIAVDQEVPAGLETVLVFLDSRSSLPYFLPVTQ